MTEPFEATPEGLRLRVRLTPRGGRDALGGTGPGRDGRPALLARVAAAATDGAANAALVRLIAGRFDVPPSAVTLTAGVAARDKTLLLRGDPAGLIERARRLSG